MSVELSKEIWNELKRHINVVDRNEAAETLVSVLIDNDVDADDIKSVFKSDTAVKAALASYVKDHQDDDHDDEDEYDEDDEDEDY
jgi:ribosomal protein L12E/L44/L45/RPP1/RPP2